jgi:Tol biopolymer transport system component
MNTSGVRVYWLLIVSSLVVLPTLSADAAELLILDDSIAAHDVFVLHAPSRGPTRQSLAENVACFAVSRDGWFLVKDLSQEWSVGRVDKSLVVNSQTIRSVPSDAQHVAVATGGKRIAWITMHNGTSRLVITELVNNRTETLYDVPMDGVISVPAWSPDARKIAFYHGPHDAMVYDGFSLVLLDLAEEDVRQATLAPPSLWTRLSPARTNPPSWSPDGKSILFEARYRTEEPPGGYYMVSVDGERLLPFPPGTWDTEGRSIYVVEPGTGDGRLIRVSRIDTAQTSSRRIIFTLEVGGRPSTVAVSPSGKYVAYILGGEVCVNEITTGRTLLCGSSGVTGKLIWLDTEMGGQ